MSEQQRTDFYNLLREQTDEATAEFVMSCLASAQQLWANRPQEEPVDALRKALSHAHETVHVECAPDILSVHIQVEHPRGAFDGGPIERIEHCVRRKQPPSAVQHRIPRAEQRG